MHKIATCVALLHCSVARNTALTRLTDGLRHSRYGMTETDHAEICIRQAATDIERRTLINSDHFEVGGARHANRRRQSKECAMKLTSTQVERALSQFKAEAIPDDHPVIPQLNNLFGEHTFFLDSIGLNIMEPTDVEGGDRPAGGRPPATQAAKVINLATWSDDNPTRLEPHEPELTDVVVVLGSTH